MTSTSGTKADLSEKGRKGIFKSFLSHFGSKKSTQKGKYVGNITHYFPKVKAGVLVLKKGPLKLGDKILIKGKTTEFEQKVFSMQVERSPIEVAKKGDEIGIQVKKRVKQFDEVFIIR